jgi:predicted ATPase/DNA-binding winged helix-turn-helix (wHTH) protein
MREGLRNSVLANPAATERKLTRDIGFAFEELIYYPATRTLVLGSRELKLGSRAGAILHAFLSRPGEILTNAELFAAAWPSTHVEEGNLRVTINALRRALQDASANLRLIDNVVGQGYRFTANVERLDSWSELGPKASNDGAPISSSLPLPLSRIVGRAGDIGDILGLLTRQRLVSVVGPGGTGKTTVALAVAHRFQEGMDAPACFVDLATISEAAMVPHVVAATLNVSLESDRPIGSLVDFLCRKDLLIVLDNCEHVIATAAELAEAILGGAPNVKLLATSHEPLSAQGEWLFKLQPLGFPSDVEELTMETVLEYPAIELFVERAMSCNQNWLMGERDLPAIAEICRRLDGIPLAIEIAAARTETLGVSELAERLEDRLKVLAVVRRTSVQRHQTIRKMLDWSYELLADAERVLLRRLSIFAGNFSLEAAVMVAGDEYLNPFAVREGVASLVRKSLLHPSSRAGTIAYRLLESTRLYALEKLGEVDESLRVKRLHLDYVTDVLRRAEHEWQNTRRASWLEAYEPIIGDARQALAWAFSENGETAPGVVLSALLVPLGLQMGLVDEFRTHVERAIQNARELAPPELLAEMRLNLVYGILNQNQVRPVSFNEAGLVRAAHLANKIGDDRFRIEPHMVSAAFNLGMGNYAVALEHIEQAMELAERVDDDIAKLGVRRVLAQISHFSGQHTRAAELAKLVLQHPVVNIPVAYGSVQVDRRVSMRIVLARTLWLEGKGDRALAVIDDAIELSKEDGPMALCQVLALAACPILLWRGENEHALERTMTLLDAASRYTLGHWHSWGKMFHAIIQNRTTGDASSVAGLVAPQGSLQQETMATLLCPIQQAAYGASERIIERSWCTPELLRVDAELILESNPNDTLAAEKLLQKSLEIARQQQAVAWELRSATVLARVWMSGGRDNEAKALLSSVRERIAEGQGTSDVSVADKVLQTLA